MATPFLFRCPVTGQHVQGTPQAASEQPGNVTRYEGLHCLACGKYHIVNPSTGKHLSEERSRGNH